MPSCHILAMCEAMNEPSTRVYGLIDTGKYAVMPLPNKRNVKERIAIAELRIINQEDASNVIHVVSQHIERVEEMISARDTEEFGRIQRHFPPGHFRFNPHHFTIDLECIELGAC